MNATKRFDFGENWKLFLSTLSDDDINTAKSSLVSLINAEDLTDKTFLDIGSGSGLFSLSAHLLGANVVSFDYDVTSVNCTNQLKNKHSKSALSWRIEQGDILDDEYVDALGEYDFVYSWGVLHHTGNMYKALENASKCVADNGFLIVAIYNTQTTTPVWKNIKQFYVGSPFIVRKMMAYFFTSYFSVGLLFSDLVKLKNPFARYVSTTRGMRLYTDVIDWIGGYPFDTAKPEEIFNFYRRKGFILDDMNTVGGKMGCNEFVFRKTNLL